MKHRLETTPGLDIRQGEIVRLERLASGEWLLTTRLEVQYTAKAVILATGTFLKGKIFVGDVSYEGGPDGMFAATELTASLLELGMRLRRFKTGTPARVLRSSIDFSVWNSRTGKTRWCLSPLKPSSRWKTACPAISPGPARKPNG